MILCGILSCFSTFQVASLKKEDASCCPRSSLFPLSCDTSQLQRGGDLAAELKLGRPSKVAFVSVNLIRTIENA